MAFPPLPPADSLAEAVAEYRATGDGERLLGRLAAIADVADVDALIAATEPYRGIPEVAGPLYERIVDRRPNDARALVVLASAYWLHGRGPEVVGELASRAIASDPANRAAWHLWALTESTPRERVHRWEQVVARFPDDQLAAANLADNAASVAGAEHDPLALALAIETYEGLLGRAVDGAQRVALERALETLRGWRL
jgi:hypothetical protein